ncbi:MAG: phenylalanine--tRNA ligase subunit alpha [Candidatus Wildermuthbacteria bacterium]|nr:phenylalanine--tRNA ligase subunit alpha [Candidatus Wildermuthbacteria bacterium]
MQRDFSELEQEAKNAIKTAQTPKELEAVLRLYTGKEGKITREIQAIPTLAVSERAEAGSALNTAKIQIAKAYAERQDELKQRAQKESGAEEFLDVTAPGKKIEYGSLHPLTLVQRVCGEIFGSMGFSIAQGPEIETEWYNFDALNIPADHPARDMWDTFWLKSEEAKSQRPKTKNPRFLLRTHTSPVQIRYLETHTPPVRIIAPGRVFRYEATDANHQINFYQLEGLVVDKDISVANFSAIIQEFFKRFFGFPVTVRLRPSYFPFTEPSFEVDMTCVVCKGKGCASCSHSGWLEIMGAGMVHPRVFNATGVDPAKWQGFAFGIGLDRLAMMKYKINDIRLLYEGDLRFLRQF